MISSFRISFEASLTAILLAIVIFFSVSTKLAAVPAVEDRYKVNS